jgi:hypothetical protein
MALSQFGANISSVRQIGNPRLNVPSAAGGLHFSVAIAGMCPGAAL